MCHNYYGFKWQEINNFLIFYYKIWLTMPFMAPLTIFWPISPIAMSNMVDIKE
jgi:hypothetical protein